MLLSPSQILLACHVVTDEVRPSTLKLSVHGEYISLTVEDGQEVSFQISTFIDPGQHLLTAEKDNILIGNQMDVVWCCVSAGAPSRVSEKR